MLHCVYHAVKPFRVVETDEFEKLLETGFWFAHPSEAKAQRKQYEDEINEKNVKKQRQSVSRKNPS